MDACHILKAQRVTAIAQKADALIQTVKKSQLHRRAGEFHGKAGKARAGADVDYPLAGKILHLQDCRAVQKMQPCHILLAGDGSEIHDLIGLFQIFKIYTVAFKGLIIIAQTQLIKAAAQKLFQHLF